MSVIVLVARANDGFVLSANETKLGQEVLKQAKTLFQNQNLLPKQISLECGESIYQYVTLLLTI